MMIRAAVALLALTLAAPAQAEIGRADCLALMDGAQGLEREVSATLRWWADRVEEVGAQADLAPVLEAQAALELAARERAAATVEAVAALCQGQL
jgi:hypothetical protein